MRSQAKAVSAIAAICGAVLVLGASPALAAKTVVNSFGAAGTGTTGGLFNQPRGVAVNNTGAGGVEPGTIYVVDAANNRIQRFSFDFNVSGFQMDNNYEFVSAWGWGVSTGAPEYEVCTVAASCRQGTGGIAPGQINVAQGIAVDQATGLVYVSDQTARRITIFSATGKLIGVFGWGVLNGAEALQFCTIVCEVAGPAGSAAGQFGNGIGGMAVDASGNLYVANESSRRVDVFKPLFTGTTPSGIEYVRGFGWGVDTGAEAFEVCTTASGCNPPAAEGTGLGQFGANSPTDVALDSAGNVFALDAGNKRVQKFSSAPAPLDAAFGSAALSTAFGTGNLYNLTIDHTDSDHLYVSGSNSANANKVAIAELDNAGALVEVHGANLNTTTAAGLAIVEEIPGSPPKGDESGNLYLSSNGDGHRVYVLNEAPVLDPITTFTGTTATFEGEVVSEGFGVSYQFEYSTDGVNWTGVPANEVRLPAQPGRVAVSQEATGLLGSQLYRVRLVQVRQGGVNSTGGGIAYSPEQTFTTPPAPPSIHATFSTAVTTKAAVLKGEINPQRQATTYRFEYGTADCASNPCTNIPVPDAGIGSGETPVDVTKEISGLTPGTTYHFRIVATNASGITEGPDTVFHTYEVPVPDTNCPNQEFRTGPSADLPNCRAYEMVSPVDKNGGGIQTACEISCNRTAVNQASLGGGKMTYSSWRAFGDAVAGAYSSQYMATRGAEGWTSHGINPHTPGDPAPEFARSLDTQFRAFLPDLTVGWVRHEPADKTFPMVRHDYVTDVSEELTAAEFAGYSADGTDTILNTGFPEGKIFGKFDGESRLISVLPNGDPNPGPAVVGYQRETSASYSFREGTSTNAVSDDASRVFWSTSPINSAADVAFYVRLNADQDQSAISGGECTEPTKACTIQVGTGQFRLADPEGSTVIYTTALGGGIYKFDVDSQTTTQIAGQQEGVLGASDDLSYIYFVSKENLAAGATAGKPNLYLLHDGAYTFIASLGTVDLAGHTTSTGEQALNGESAASGYDIASRSQFERPSRVTPDGRHIAFQSIRSLTGYDNIDANNGEPDTQVYTYDADANKLICASCNPSGVRPVGGMYQLPFRAVDAPAGRLANSKTSRWTAAWLTTSENQHYTPRALSDDGSRLFFNAFDALVPQDTNGQQDVYQWEAEGTGDCTKSRGCVSLISSGDSPAKSEFIDATPDGREVFFETESSLLPQDPGETDIYVARIGGGVPQPPPAPPCVGDACQDIPPAPNDQTPASASFRGAGDPKAAGDCTASARQAARLRRAGKNLRNQAGQAQSPRQAKQLRMRSARLLRKASALSKSANRCRRENRRASK